MEAQCGSRSAPGTRRSSGPAGRNSRDPGAGAGFTANQAGEAGHGLEAGFRQAYREHAPAVFRAAYRAALGDRHAAEDATQQAFLEAFRAWPVKGPGLRSWLCQRAISRVIDSWRKTGAEYPDDNLHDLPGPRNEEDTVLAVIAADVFWKKVTSEVSSRAAFLAWEQGMSVTEIAEHLGIARRTVRRDLDNILAIARQPGYITSLEGGETR